MKLGLSLARCGRCGKPYANPLTHVCVTRIGRKPRKTKAGVRLALSCGRCGKRMSNPFLHKCVTKTDFRRRKKAAAAAARRARPAKPKHEYQACRDGDCQRVACVAWKEAWAEGRAEGHEAGYLAGYAAGHAAASTVKGRK